VSNTKNRISKRKRSINKTKQNKTKQKQEQGILRNKKEEGKKTQYAGSPPIDDYASHRLPAPAQHNTAKLDKDPPPHKNEKREKKNVL